MSNVVGSKEWGDTMRLKARTLASKLESGYMELAEILYRVYSTPKNNDAKQLPLWKTWGYENFAQYAEEEVGLHYKKANSLINIWYRLEVEMENLDPSLKARITKLGWTKVRELVRVLKVSNAEQWVEKAEMMSYPTLCATIAKFKDQEQNKEIEAAVAKTEGDVVTKSNDIETPAEDPADDPANVLHPVDPAKEVIEEQKMFAFHFNLFPDQAESLKLALHRAGELSNSPKQGHNLSLIALDFLATNDFTKANGEQQLKFIARLEKALGFRLIAVDKNNEVVYGLKTLNELANAKE